VATLSKEIIEWKCWLCLHLSTSRKIWSYPINGLFIRMYL